MELLVSVPAFLEHVQAAVASVQSLGKAEARLEMEAFVGETPTGGSLVLRTKTDDGWLERRLEGTRVKTGGRCVIPADRLLRVVKGLAEDSEVELKRKGNAGPITLRPILTPSADGQRAPKRRFTLLAEEGQGLGLDMPPVEWQDGWTLPQASLWKRLVSGGGYARATDRGESVALQGVWLECGGRETRIVSTDRNRLATAWWPRPVESDEQLGVVLSHRVLDVLARQLDPALPLSMGVAQDRQQQIVAWKQGTFTYVTYVVKGDFPQWRRALIPLQGDGVRRLRVAHSAFRLLLTQLRPLVSDHPDDPKRVEFHLDVSSSAKVTTPDAGEAEISEIAAFRFDGAPAMLPFDLDYLEPAVLAMGEAKSQQDPSLLRLSFIAVDKAVVLELDAPVADAVQMQALIAPLKQSPVS